jgi:hypothetical protein
MVAVSVAASVAAPGVAPGQEARGPERAAQTAQAAAREESAGRLDQAIRLYERAYWEHPDAMYIYRRVLLYERMKRYQAGLALLEGNREELARSEQITDLALVEQRLRDGVRASRAADVDGGEAGQGWSWALVGGGAALTAVGAVALVWAGQEADERACSLSSSADKSGCAAAEQVVWEQSRFEESQSRESTLRVVGVVGLVVGVGALGVGVWRLVSAPDEASALRWEIAPTAGGAAVRLGWSF